MRALLDRLLSAARHASLTRGRWVVGWDGRRGYGVYDLERHAFAPFGRTPEARRHAHHARRRLTLGLEEPLGLDWVRR